MTIGTYILTETKSGKFYVGSSKDVDKRIDRHFNELEKDIHHCSPVQALWNDGKSFTVSVFELETRDEAYILEQSLISKNLQNPKLLNVGIGVKGGDNLTRNPNREVIIARMTETLNKRLSIMTPHEKKLLWGRSGALNGMFGKTHSEAVKNASRKRATGNKYCLGLKKSIKQRLALSEMAKLRIGEKNSFFGKTHSDVTKRKIAKAKLGILPPNMRPVSVNGVVYISLAEAGRQLGIPVPTMLWRVKSPNKKFSGYVFVTEMPND